MENLQQPKIKIPDMSTKDTGITAGDLSTMMSDQGSRRELVVRVSLKSEKYISKN